VDDYKPRGSWSHTGIWHFQTEREARDFVLQAFQEEYKEAVGDNDEEADIDDNEEDLGGPRRSKRLNPEHAAEQHQQALDLKAERMIDRINEKTGEFICNRYRLIMKRICFNM